MATSRTFETARHAPHVALAMVDRLAQALRTAGAFPPPMGDIRCELLATVAPDRGFDPPRWLGLQRTRAGYFTFDGRYAVPTDPARDWPLEAGVHPMRVSGEFYRPATFDLTWPPPEDRRVRVYKPAPDLANLDNIELDPSPAYPLPDLTLGLNQLGPTVIRGCARQADGSALEGINVEVVGLVLLVPVRKPPLGLWPFLRTTTAANGDWAIVLPGRLYIDAAPESPVPAQPLTKAIDVRLAYPDGALTVTRTVLLGAEHSLRNTGLRGQVTGSDGRPVAGAVIASSLNAATSTTAADGTWTLCFAPGQLPAANVTVTATADSRSIGATVDAVADRIVVVSLPPLSPLS